MRTGILRPAPDPIGRRRLPASRFRTDFSEYRVFSPQVPFATGRYGPSKPLRKAGLHPSVELGAIVSGTARLYAAGDWYELAAGDAFFVDAMMPHGVEPAPGTTAATVVAEVKPESVMRVSPREGDLRLYRPFLALRAGQVSPVLRRAPDIRDLLIEAHEARVKAGALDDLRAWTLVVRALVVIAERVSLDTSGTDGPGQTGAVVRAVDYIHEHACERFSMGQLARHCALSPSRLTHVFSEAMHMPPVRYRSLVRVRRAIELLATSSRKIADISQACGFGSPSRFYAEFRAVTGSTPDTFRR